MRIAVIYIGQETNDFNPMPTTLAHYRAFGLHEGADVLDKLDGLGQIGGHLKAAADSGLEVETVPLIRAWASAGGRLSRETFDYFQERIRALLGGVGKIDGLHLQLHGACAADGIDDVEGEQIALCRAILGPDMPILLGLDHHANITRKMVENATAIVGHRTQPHDTFDTGVIGAQLLFRIVKGEVKPVTAWRKVPLVTHQEQFLTSKGPMKRWFDRARAMEADPRVLQASNYPMQPWLDVEGGGWTTIVCTDNDPALANRLAEELADLAWSMRDDFLVREAVTPDEAVRRASAAKSGMVVISDTGDTVWGGAAGDSNVLLEAMLRLGIDGKALVPMIAPDTVAKLIEAGEGATVTLPLGGHVAKQFFTPLTVTGRVRKIGGGVVRLKYSHQPEVDLGRAVLFDVGPVTLMLTELNGVAGNVPGAYEAMGLDLKDYKMAVLKTASNFQFFAPISSEVIRADTRGPGQSDVYTLPWQRLPRPIYPLEPLDDWRGKSA